MTLLSGNIKMLKWLERKYRIPLEIKYPSQLSNLMDIGTLCVFLTNLFQSRQNVGRGTLTIISQR